MICQRTIYAFGDKFRAKIRDREKATGIHADLSDVEKAREEIVKKKLRLKKQHKMTKRKSIVPKQRK